MSTPPSPRRQFFEPLHGDESGHFELQLVRDALSALEDRLAATELFDDFVFQSHLRYLASLHCFLGGINFDEVLARQMRKSVETVRRWINGQSAPAPSIREEVLSAAMLELKNVELTRRSGASLYDLASRLK